MAPCNPGSIQRMRPFSAAGFTNWFSEKAQEAGCRKGSTLRGIRKAAARRLAETGCTPHQIMAITGLENLSEVALYTASADQERLADEAMERVENGTNSSNRIVEPVNVSNKFSGKSRG